MKKQDRRVARSIKSIETAYLQLLTEKDPDRITVTEIAKRADIDRKTFYLHYSGVEGVMERIGKRKGADFLMKILEYREKGGQDPVDTFFDAFDDVLSEDLQMFQQISSLDSDSSLWTGIQSHVEQFLDEIMQEYTALADSERLLAVKLYSSGIINVYSSWLRGEIKCELKLLSSQVKVYVRKGIRL